MQFLAPSAQDKKVGSTQSLGRKWTYKYQSSQGAFVKPIECIFRLGLSGWTRLYPEILLMKNLAGTFFLFADGNKRHWILVQRVAKHAPFWYSKLKCMLSLLRNNTPRIDYILLWMPIRRVTLAHFSKASFQVMKQNIPTHYFDQGQNDHRLPKLMLMNFLHAVHSVRKTNERTK